MNPAGKFASAGDTAAFYEETRRVLRGRSHWLTVRLALATETPLFDALVPLGGELTPVRDLTSFRLAVATRQPVISYVDRTFLLWAIAGLLLPFALGWIIGGTVFAGLTGLLWGGLVRVFVLHHFTYSINSLCHTFGRREFETSDHSRNLALIAIPTLGEAFHNSHHAFPTSATHGLRWYQVDISALVIDGLEKVGLVWDVVRVSPERQASKAAAKTA